MVLLALSQMAFPLGYWVVSTRLDLGNAEVFVDVFDNSGNKLWCSVTTQSGWDPFEENDIV